MSRRDAKARRVFFFHLGWIPLICEICGSPSGIFGRVEFHHRMIRLPAGGATCLVIQKGATGIPVIQKRVAHPHPFSARTRREGATGILKGTRQFSAPVCPRQPAVFARLFGRVDQHRQHDSNHRHGDGRGQGIQRLARFSGSADYRHGGVRRDWDAPPPRGAARGQRLPRAKSDESVKRSSQRPSSHRRQGNGLA